MNSSKGNIPKMNMSSSFSGRKSNSHKNHLSYHGQKGTVFSKGNIGSRKEGLNTVNSNSYSSAEKGSGLHSSNYSGKNYNRSSQNSKQTNNGASLKDSKKPDIYIWPKTLDFGSIAQDSSAHQKVIIMNIGNADLVLGKTEYLDKNAPFIIFRDNCFKKTLGHGESCSVDFRFRPRMYGETYESAFKISHNVPKTTPSQNYVRVIGKSYLASKMHDWRSAGSIDQVDFGIVPMGYSLQQLIRVTNLTKMYFGKVWENITLDTSNLPKHMRVFKDRCTGKNLNRRDTCFFWLEYKPITSSAISYHVVDITTGKRSISRYPQYPLAIENPVTQSFSGSIGIHANGELVSTLQIKAKTCASYPVHNLKRNIKFYFLE